MCWEPTKDVLLITNNNVIHSNPPEKRILLEGSIKSDSLRPLGWNPPGSCPWNFSGKKTGVSCHFFLQGIFPTQGLNLGLLSLLH